MKVFIEKIEAEQEEQVRIACHKVTPRIREIEKFVYSGEQQLEGMREGRLYTMVLSDICYVESVDDHLFAYTGKEVFELKCRLYEFEEAYGDRKFFRCAKAAIVNLMKIRSLRPALNGRFAAMLENGEEIIISRKYVGALRERLRGGNEDA